MEIKRDKGFITVIGEPKIDHFLITGYGQIRGVAKCDPSDEFNEEFGTDLARKRAVEKLNKKRYKSITKEIEIFKRESEIYLNRLIKKQKKIMKKLELENNI